MNLLILGAGGHGRVALEVAEATGQYDNIAFLDDNKDRSNIIGKLSNYDKFTGQFDYAFVAIGKPEVRKKYQELLTHKYKIATLIDPSAHISPSSSVGIGTLVMIGAVIQANCRIGAGCIISAGAIVDHDSVLNDYCHINAGAIVPSMSTVVSMTKLDYGALYHGTPDDEWIEEYKRQFGTEPSFF
ncbi:MAG: PglB [Clostridiales bacterium]|nr:PglB [Clostridiales bacterium]